MNKGKLSQEEKTLLDAVESGEYESTLTKSRKKELEAAANLTFKKDKRINICISASVVSGLLHPCRVRKDCGGWICCVFGVRSAAIQRDRRYRDWIAMSRCDSRRP